MDIIKRTVKDNNNILIVSDQGITYPILLESLHSKVIFDSLVASGYEFCGLPFDFRKDGKSIVNMPESDVLITDAEMQEMFDALNAETYTQEELRARIVEAKVTFIAEPETEYTILTREDFISFLEAFNGEDGYASFKPINSFVHPNARFSVDEMFESKNKQYVDILDNYRKFNLSRWLRLLSWIGKPMESFRDVIKYYYQWGLDGVNLPIIASSEQTITILDGAHVNADTFNYAMLSRKELGLIDKDGTLLIPEESKGIKWDYVNTKETILDIRRKLKDNETALVELKTYIKDTVTINEGLHHTLRISSHRVTLDKISYNQIRVYPNGLAFPSATFNLCNSNKINDLVDYAYMQALAYETVETRVAPSSASSARALELMGATKRCILNYITNHIGANRTVGSQDENNIPITYDVITAYVTGQLNNQDTADYLGDILDGVYNIDSIASAKAGSRTMVIERCFQNIYVLHKIFKLSIDEIRDRIVKMGEDPSFTVEHDGYKFVFRQSMDRGVFNAFNKDIQNYRFKAAKEANKWFYITEAIRELGTAEAKRHVAFRAYMVYTESAKVKMLSSILENKFIDYVKAHVAEGPERDLWLKDSRYFVATHFFEIALKGQITYPQKLGGDVERVEASLVSQYYSCLEEKAEALHSICDLTMFEDKFRFFFVNAYVTPMQIIPLKNQTIKQRDFSAIWVDYRSNPVVLAKLVERGAIPAGYVAWENFATDSVYTVIMHEFRSITSVYGYHLKSAEYISEIPNDVKFKSVPHPCEYSWPDVYMNEDEDVILPSDQVRTAPPKYSVLPEKDIKFEDYPEYFDLELRTKESNKIVPFTGFTATDLYMMSDVAKGLTTTILPGEDFVSIKSGDKFYTSVDDSEHYINDIPAFAGEGKSIINIWGRHYLIRDFRGKYFRVEV